MIITLITISLSCVIGITLYMLYKAHHDILNDRVISIGLPDSNRKSRPLHIFFISDIHRRIVRRETIALVSDEIDMIVIGGDLVEKGVSLEKARENINRLKSLNAPIYFIWGNNDFEVNKQALIRMLEEEGVYILKNQVKTCQHGEIPVNIIGLDYYKKGKPNYDISRLPSGNDAYNILLTHDPRAFHRFSQEEQQHIHLVLSGHTHGGQIRFMGIGLYEKGGLKTVGNTPVFTSEGYGYTKLPFRLGTNAECHILRIK